MVNLTLLVREITTARVITVLRPRIPTLTTTQTRLFCLSTSALSELTETAMAPITILIPMGAHTTMMGKALQLTLPAECPAGHLVELPAQATVATVQPEQAMGERNDSNHQVRYRRDTRRTCQQSLSGRGIKA